jgi:hypothetical protein
LVCRQIKHPQRVKYVLLIACKGYILISQFVKVKSEKITEYIDILIIENKKSHATFIMNVEREISALNIPQ